MSSFTLSRSFFGFLQFQCFHSHRVWDCVILRGGGFHYRPPREMNPPLLLRWGWPSSGWGWVRNNGRIRASGSHSCWALIVSTFLQQRGAWRGGRNACCTGAWDEWQRALGLQENCSGLCFRMPNEDWFVGLQRSINRDKADPHVADWGSAEFWVIPHLLIARLLSWLIFCHLKKSEENWRGMHDF